MTEANNMFSKYPGISFWRTAIILATAIATVSPLFSNKSNAQSPDKTATTPARQIKINLDQATALAIPGRRANLQPASFRTRDGRTGWVIRLPGNRPIATPAYADGMLFVGGGYGSYEFYALDAQSGRVRWKIKTKDDGPTAAVVEDGYVAFNTESCTVFVVEARTGRLVWHEWLGDPLMSQPAISKGRLYIAHPAGQRGGNQLSQLQQPPAQQNQQSPPAPLGTTQDQWFTHKLLCADLKTGRHIWEQPIPGDVITAPVVEGDRVYFTCFDGTSYCLQASDGKLVWKEQNAGTSAPLVVGDQVMQTQKAVSNGKSYEGLTRADRHRGKNKDGDLLAKKEAGYLKENNGGGVGISQTSQTAMDASVGFSAAPSAANLAGANSNVGVNTVAGAWAYQGSRIAYARGQMLNAQGRFLNSLNAKDGKTTWQAEFSGDKLAPDAQIFGPPSLGKENMYLASPLGYLLAVSQQSGERVFLYKLGKEMAFQPALVKGNIYVGTVDGLLICLRTGQADADGWYSWGGNAQHNKNH